MRLTTRGNHTSKGYAVVMQHLFCNLSKTIDRAIRYQPTIRNVLGTGETNIDESANGDLDLYAYGDASYADNKVTRRSTAGYVMMLAGGLVAWKSAEQRFVATSTFEAEFCNMMPTAKTLL